MKYLQVELPNLHLKYIGKNGEEFICSAIRTNHPKPSLIFIPPIIKNTGLFEVEVVDMKINDQCIITPYKEIPYGNGTIIASRMGMPFQKLESKILGADVLGISINITSWAKIAVDFMSYAKRVNPKIITIIGGTDPCFRSEFYLNTGLVDYIVRGEAEYTLPELLEGILRRDDISKVKGISYKTSTDIIKTEVQKKVQMNDIPLQSLELFKEDINLWTTPADYFPFQRGIKPGIGFIFLSRGCSENCEFCSTPKKMGAFRHKALEKIEQEIKHFKEFGINTLNIWDDSLSSILKSGQKLNGRRYLIDVFNLLKRENIAYEFSQGVVIKHLYDEEKNAPDYELIEAMFSNEIRDGNFIGCYAEYFPLECLQEETRYSKLMSFEKELEVLKAILNTGHKAISFTSMMGTENDTTESFKKAIQKIKDLVSFIESNGSKALATPFIFSIFPGTRVWNKYCSSIKYPIEEYPELYQFNTATHETRYFKPEEITLAKKELEKEVMTEKQYQEWNKTGRYQWKS